MASAHFPELTDVRLTRDVEIDGHAVAAGTEGTIMGVYADGMAYEVEFFAPRHMVLTIEARDLRA